MTLLAIEHLGFLANAKGAHSNGYVFHLDRELRITDVQVFKNPKLNPQWIDFSNRTMSTDEPIEDLYREHFTAFSTDELYRTLDRSFLFVFVGQIIHRIIIERDAWDATRIGRTATYTPCFCSTCAALRADVERTSWDERVADEMREWAQHFDDTLAALKRSAA
jgi:hypothetical protein